MEPGVAVVIKRTSIVGAVLGVVFSPIPLIDELLLMPVYAVMTSRIARAKGLPSSRIPWRPIMSTAVAGLSARAAVNLTVSYIPFVSAAANAVSAVALTQFLGRFIDGACDEPERANAVSFREILEDLRAQIQKRRGGGQVKVT